MRRITALVKKYKDVLNSIGVVVALVGLFCLIAQTCSLAEQTHSLEEQTHIMSEQFGLTYRPYLAVEDITMQEEGDSSLEILITLKNYGQVPATAVNLQEVVIGGAGVAYDYDEETGTLSLSYAGSGAESSPGTTTPDDTTGVSITASGYVTAMVEQGYPADFIFFPGKEQTIIATVNKSTYQTEVLETNLMHIALLYAHGLERYYYIADASLQDGTWTVVEQRGN